MGCSFIWKKVNSSNVTGLGSIVPVSQTKNTKNANVPELFFPGVCTENFMEKLPFNKKLWTCEVR